MLTVIARFATNLAGVDCGHTASAISHDCQRSDLVGEVLKIIGARGK